MVEIRAESCRNIIVVAVGGAEPALLEQIVYIFGLLLIEFSKHLRELVKKLFKSGDICHIDLPEK